MAATIQQQLRGGLGTKNPSLTWSSEERERQSLTSPSKKSRHRASTLLLEEYLRDPLQWWDKAATYQDSNSRNKMVYGHGIAFVSLLRACAKNKDLHSGTIIHDDILKRGSLDKCSNALVIMYAMCGALAEAQHLLSMHNSQDACPWTALITGYASQGRSQDALICYEQMQREGLFPDRVTFACILNACGTLRAADKGEKIHDEIARQGLLQDNDRLGTALVEMYAKCGALAKARCVLEELPSRTVVSWNALILGYVQHSQGDQALSCFERMQHEGIAPNAMTFSCILKACGALRAADKGKQIHDVVVRKGLLRKDVVLGNALVDMYVKCGVLSKAQQVLEELPSRNAVTWNSLIGGYVQQGQAEQALHCFRLIQDEGFSPSAVTYACILKSCGILGDVDKGEQIHDEIAKQGLLQNDGMLGCALVDMYAKCGALVKAQQVLEQLSSRNVVSWSALIAGYAQHGQGEQALNCFEHMQQEGIAPNAVTFTCILKACGTLRAADKGSQIHDEINKQGLLGSNLVLSNALVDMYAKCGSLAKAQQVLEELPFRDVVTWNTVIAGYVHHGQGEQALSCFECMQREGMSPDVVTFACVLKACGIIGASDKGTQIHEEIAKHGLLGNSLALGNTLVDMYAKCGALTKALRVLEELPSRDVVSWNALIAGYTQQGQGEQALSCFERMQREGILPDVVTFSCILNVCTHLGLVDDGYMHFVNMITKYGVKPNLEIYTCMIDLFGRAGNLERALRIIHKMPSSDYSAVWHAVLGACEKRGDVHVGRWAFEQAVQVNKSDGAAYVLMANIYAAAGMQVVAKDIEAMRMENIAWKEIKM